MLTGLCFLTDNINYQLPTLAPNFQAAFRRLHDCDANQGNATRSNATYKAECNVIRMARKAQQQNPIQVLLHICHPIDYTIYRCDHYSLFHSNLVRIEEPSMSPGP